MVASPRQRSFVLVALLAAGPGCADTYYKAWEKLGYEKRDILVSRVEKARDEQTDAKQQFTSTLDQFKALTGFNGGDLEAEYETLNSSYNDCETEAAAVTKRINSVDKVAQAMFAEWQAELDQYQDQGLRASSAQKLDRQQAAVRRAAGGHAEERGGHAAGAGGVPRPGAVPEAQPERQRDQLAVGARRRGSTPTCRT